MSIETQTPSETIEFWASSYRGQDIAVHRHHRGWLVYSNKVMQTGMLFASARDAATWLRRKVDQESATAG
ncbi:MAG: hypothetical protein ACR2PG_26060 [Hyphomicrobiaceae bacterium]